MKTIQKYRPNITKSQSWNFIENRFKKDFGHCHFKLIELVEHIIESKLSLRLFGSTSMDKLLVSIYEEIDYRKETLHITFNLDKNEWHFEYFAMPFTKAEFVKIYSVEKGIEKFDNFIKMLKW